MAMRSERSKSLHNFALPQLKWGNQKFLRCGKETGNSSGDSSVTDRRSQSSETESMDLGRSRSFVSCKKSSPLNPMKTGRGGGGGGSHKVKNDLTNAHGIDEVREKLMFDLKVAADKMKLSMLEKKEFHECIPPAAKPWNLRTRQTSFTPPLDVPENFAAKSSNSKPKKRSSYQPRAKFSISLSQDEIKHDFLSITGNRPARHLKYSSVRVLLAALFGAFRSQSKKRPRTVQKQLNAVFPGLWLSEITPDDYKVEDAQVPGKVPG